MTQTRRKTSTADASAGAEEARALLSSGGYKGIEYSYMIDVDVRWGDMDSMGHVNNTVFFKYFEEARCGHFHDIGMTIGGSTPEGPILAEASCKFRSPIVHPDTLTVGAECIRVDDTSWIQRYAAVSHQSGQVVAEGEAKLVWFDYQRGKRKTFSEDAKVMLFGSGSSESL